MRKGQSRSSNTDVPPPSRRSPADPGRAGDDPAERVRLTARALGFTPVGISRADVPLDRDIARYDAFIADGKHGKMHSFSPKSHLRERLDADGLLRGTKSVVCVARRYPRSPTSARQESSDRLPAMREAATTMDFCGGGSGVWRLSCIRRIRTNPSERAAVRRRAGSRAGVGGAGGTRV